MTDYSLVKEQLKALINCDEEQAQSYECYINNAISCITPCLKSTLDENDARVVLLCAVKAYYQISLTDASGDDITSFKAGDVSFERDTSALPKIKALYDMALEDCAPLLSRDGFAFRTV